jgi:hypothetical protein
MTPKQQNLVAPYAFFEGGWHHDKHALPEEEISRAVYRVKPHTETGRRRDHQGKEIGPLITVETLGLRVEFPSLDAGASLWLRTTSPSPPPAAAGKP